MKNLITLLLFSMTLFAASMQKVPHTFSDKEKELFLKELSSSSSTLYTSKVYSLKKGWNKLRTPKDGIDTIQTFKDISKVKFVVTYDNISKLWAMYTNDKNYKRDNLLFLKYLEPNITFFVLANKNVKVDIKSISINEACQKFIDNKLFDTIYDSGISKDIIANNNNTMSIQSRYYPHHKRGLYDDTRVVLIYPKINTKTKATLDYGPAKPKIKIKYAKEYENKSFYVYDYKLQSCYKGVFPSAKIPPFPILREVK